MNIDILPPVNRREQMERVEHIFREMEESADLKKFDFKVTLYKEFTKIESHLLPATDSVRTSVQEFWAYLDEPDILSRGVLDRINEILDLDQALKEQVDGFDELAMLL